MFRIISMLALIVFAVVILVVSIVFISLSSNLWWFIGILVSLFILFILFIIINLKVRTKRESKRAESDAWQKAYDEKMTEEIRIGKLKKKAEEMIEFEEILKEVAEGRKHKNNK